MDEITFAFEDRQRALPAAEAEALKVDLVSLGGPNAEDAFELARKLQELIRGAEAGPLAMNRHEERALLEVLDRYEIEGRLTSTLRHLQMALEPERAPDL
jgi:hypothetical protein